MLTSSNTLAIILLICAVGDTIGAKYILPRMLNRNPALNEAQKKLAVSLVNGSSILFFIAALAVYFLQPLD